MRKEFDTVVYEKEGDIAQLTLNRPAVGNAFDDQMFRDIEAGFLEAEQDVDAKVLIVKGAGADFSVGEDLSGDGTSELLPNEGERSLWNQMEKERQRLRRWEGLFNFPRPAIAQVQGRCHGAGLFLASICDIVIASHDSTFGDRMLWTGVTPSNPLLLWQMGAKKARELLLAGRYFSADEAERCGLITRVVPRDQLDREVLRYAQGMCVSPADGLAWVKDIVIASVEARGVGGAWRHAVTSSALADVESPLAEGGEFNFRAARRSRGLQAALRERDELLRD